MGHDATTGPGSMRRRIGRGLLILLLIATAACLALIWTARDAMRQQQYVQTLLALLAATALLAIGVFIGWRARWRTKFTIAVAALLLLVVAGALLRIEGVSGDLVPRFVWRWSAPAPAAGPDPLVVPSPSAPPSGLADYPQFLGPHRRATLTGPRLSSDWAGRPPRLCWRIAIGAGWSSFAVRDGRAVTQEQEGDDELVTCRDVATGALLWRHRDRVRYASTIAGIGPRATPTLEHGRVYTMGATGLLNCLDLETGSRHFSVDVLKDNDAPLNEWGTSGSPLVVDDRVIVNAGGPNGRSLVAYDRHTGTRLWAGGDDRASYSSPLIADLHGVRQVLILNHQSLAGHAPDTGAVLWSHPWPGDQPKVSQLLVLPGDRVFASSSYGVGCALFQVGHEAGAWSIDRTWKRMTLKAKFTNTVLHEGFIYGLDESVLVCLDPETGRRRWKKGRYGHGQVLLVPPWLLVVAESGEVALVEASPDQLVERARFQAITGKTWNHPALAGRFLLVRNDREAACYELPVEEDSGG